MHHVGWRCITSDRLGCRHRSAGGAQHHVCPCACSNADFQHTQPKRMARWAIALGVSVQAQNNDCSTSSKQSRRWLFNKLNFFSNVLLSFNRIGQFALFPLKEKIQQIDLFKEKKRCQVLQNITTTGFKKVSTKPRNNRIRCSMSFTTKSRLARSPFCRN